MKVATLAPLISLSACAGLTADVQYGGEPRSALERPVTSTADWPDFELANPSPLTLERDSLTQRLAGAHLAGLHFEDESSLRSVMRFLAAATGVNIYVEQVAEDAQEDAGGGIDLVIDRPIALVNALNLVCELAGDDVAWTPRNGIVIVTTTARARGEPKKQIFDVSDLTRGIPSFAPPRMDLSPSGGLSTETQPGLVERAPYMDEDWLLEVIRSTVAPGTWDEPGNSISIRNGRLFVRHD